MSSSRSESVARQHFRWLLVVFVAAVICYFSLFASPNVGVDKLGPLGFVGRDKWFHATGYAVFAATIAAALSASRDDHRRVRVVLFTLAVAVAVVFGVAMEIAQMMVPRDPSVWDAAADTFGAVIGVLALACSWRVAGRDEADLRS